MGHKQPHFAQSNGEVEQAEKTTKSLLKKEKGSENTYSSNHKHVDTQQLSYSWEEQS